MLTLPVIVLIVELTSPGWWVAVEARYHDDGAWDWLERMSWLAAIIPALVMFVVWVRSRPGASSAPAGALTHVGTLIIQADPAALIAPMAPPSTGRMINQDGGRMQLESGLASSRSTLIMVVGPPGAGKSTLVECVFQEQGRRPTSAHQLRWEGGFDAKALLDAIEGRPIDLRSDEDVLERLIAALEDGDAPPAVVWVDGAQVLVDPETNRFRDLRLEEALSIVTSSRPRQAIVILALEKIPEHTGDSGWPQDRVIVPVNRLSTTHFLAYLHRLDVKSADPQRLHVVLHGTPGLADLFAIALGRSGANVTEASLVRRLAKRDHASVESILAEVVIAGLDDDQVAVLAVLVAYNAPVTETWIANLAKDRLPSGRVSVLLGELVDMNIVNVAEHRHAVSNQAIAAAVSRTPVLSQRLLRRAVRVILDEGFAIEQVEHLRDLERFVILLDVQVRAERWLSAFGTIGQLHDVLRRWQATDLLRKYRDAIKGNLEDPYREAVNYNALGNIHLARGDVDHALSAFGAAVRAGDGTTERELVRSTVFLNMAEAHWQRNDVRSARDCFDSALCLAQEHADESVRARALAGLADCHRRWGAFGEAIRIARDALAAARAERLPEAVRIAVRLGRWCSELGDHDEAERVMDIGHEETRAHGHRDGALSARWLDGRADLALDAGDLEAAQRLAEAAVAEALNVHAPVIVLQARTTLTMVLLQRGRLDEAKDVIDRARPYQRPGRSLVVLTLSALLAFRTGDEDGARSDFASLARQAADRWRADDRDFAAADLEGVALVAAHIVQGRPLDPALDAFRRARSVVPVLPPVLAERLTFMLSVLTDRLPPAQRESVSAAAAGDANQFEPF